MSLILTPDDYAAIPSFLRTAAVRSITNQRGRETYARVGLVAGMVGKSMAETQRLIDSDDSASLPPAYKELLYARGVQFWDQVIKGANSALKNRAFGEASEVQSALRGVSGEDMAQIYAVGGQKFPGMKFLENRRADPDADPVPLRAYPDAAKGTKAEKVLGQLVPFDAPVFPVNSNIYMHVGMLGRRSGKDPGKHSWFAKKLYSESFQRTLKYVRATKPQQYIAFPETEGQTDTLIPGYDGPGDLTAMNLSNPYFINAIDKAVRRRVSGKPTQEWLWGAITMATGKGGKPLLRPVKDRSLPLVLKSTALLKWVEENDYPMPAGIGGRKSLSRSWPKLYKQMLAAYDDLDRSTIQRGIGMVTGPARALFRDPDVRDVYLQEITRRRASAHRVAAKWAGLLDPVEKGLLEVLKHSPTQSSIIEDEDMRAATALVQKGLAEWFTDFELALTDQGRRKRAALDPVSIGEMMLSAVSQIRLFHNLEGAYDRYLDVYEKVGMNLVRLGHFQQKYKNMTSADPDFEDVAERSISLKREIADGMEYLHGRAREIDQASEALKKMSDAYALVAKVKYF